MTGGQSYAIDYSLSKTSLYEQVADTLEKAIIELDGKVEKLPSEQELGKRFNVSRSVIREALRALKERGFIEPRNGEGSYISRPNSVTVSSAVDRLIRTDNISSSELHGTRQILELAAVRLAALHSVRSDIERMELTLDCMADTSLPLPRRIAYDADFHVAIARSGGNELLATFVDVMTMLLKSYMAKGITGVEGIEKTLREHHRVLDAIKLGDPGAAETALREHLTASWENVLEYERKNGNCK